MLGMMRLHLSTLLTLTLVAGVLLGLNMNGRSVEIRATEALPKSGVSIIAPGWPFAARGVEILEVESRDDGPYVTAIGLAKWDIKFGVPANTVVALLILLLTAVGCEMYMRRTRFTGTVATHSD